MFSSSLALPKEIKVILLTNEKNSDLDQNKLILSFPANSFNIQMLILIATVREDVMLFL